jgi:quinol---cytochrome c reductase iron-sulfur subunit, bacillus type
VSEKSREPETNEDRRGFLLGLVGLLFLVPLLGPFVLALRTAVGPARRRGPHRIPTLPLAEIPEDSVRPFMLRYVQRVGAFREEIGRQVFLRRKGDRVLALSSQCTHLGCPVRFERAGPENGRPEARLHCPCHKGSFDLEGVVLDGPPQRPLHRFSTEIPSDKGQPVLVVIHESPA